MRNSDKSPNESWDLGGGHSRLNLALTDRVEIGRVSTAAVAGEIPDTDGGHSYFQAMIDRWGGRENAEQAINQCSGRPPSHLAQPPADRLAGPRHQAALRRG